MRKIIFEKKLYIITAAFFTCLSAHASENAREDDAYSSKAATCIKNVSTATFEAIDECTSSTDRCIKTMSPVLKLVIKISEFILKLGQDKKDFIQN